MLLSLMGLIFSITLFSMIGAALLRRRWRSLLPVFVVAAHVGFYGYAYVFGKIFADDQDQLPSDTVVFFLIGLPLVGTLAGLAATRIVERLRPRAATAAEPVAAPDAPRG
jgi:hypothetical protein